MKNSVINIEHLTKSYGVDKGVFDLSFDVKEGEVFGFIGPNGAGKTTTIRHLLGFIHPDQGRTTILDLDTIKDAPKIQESLGYLPGEIAFFDHMKGIEFLKLMASLRHLESTSYMHELIAYFELDVQGYIKKMSKGMKQKLGLVAACMHEPKVLILDEPTSGLDPLMQTKFVEFILNEKKKGTTVLMSSHSFEEIEKTCDRALVINKGRNIALEDIQSLKKTQRKVFLIRFKDNDSYDKIVKSTFEVIPKEHLEVEVTISGDINPLIKALSLVHVEHIDVKTQSLEEIFLDYYKKEATS